MQGQHDVPFDEGASTVSGTLYLSGEAHCALLNDVYTRFSHTPTPCMQTSSPSVRQMELEVLAMTAAMVGGEGSPRASLLISASLLPVRQVLSVVAQYKSFLCIQQALKKGHVSSDSALLTTGWQGI